MEIGTNLQNLNWQLNLKYQESIKQGVMKVDNKLYQVEITTQRLEFQFSASSLSTTQFGDQMDWKMLADQLMKGAPKFPATPDEAKQVISDDGFYGVPQTSTRMADFVIFGAGDNADLLKAGRAGIIQGFKEAEKLWGDKLPDISYQTLEKALEKIDEHIKKLGLNILDVEG